MTWNYRVTIIDDIFGISEVYYNNKGKITNYSNHVAPYGENSPELKKNFRFMKEAFNKPILKENPKTCKLKEL